MTICSVARPERNRPDSRVSPMTPAPKIAVVLHRQYDVSVLIATQPARRQAAQEEPDVGGPLRHPPHEVAVPLVPYGM
jgi:hypothetical protein